MQELTVSSPPLLGWGVASRPLQGQPISGDSHLVKLVPAGALFAAVDGIGHGEEAAAAAGAAISVLENHPDDSLPSLVSRCHQALVRTRGVVMTVAFLHAQALTLSWLGVGNVEGLLFRADPAAWPRVLRPILRPGIVGSQLPELRVSVHPVAPGDLVVFATDGIGAGFADGWDAGGPPPRIARQILDRHFKGTDDALVLVVRNFGAAHE